MTRQACGHAGRRESCRRRPFPAGFLVDVGHVPHDPRQTRPTPAGMPEQDGSPHRPHGRYHRLNADDLFMTQVRLVGECASSVMPVRRRFAHEVRRASWLSGSRTARCIAPQSILFLFQGTFRAGFRFHRAPSLGYTLTGTSTYAITTHG